MRGFEKHNIKLEKIDLSKNEIGPKAFELIVKACDILLI